MGFEEVERMLVAEEGGRRRWSMLGRKQREGCACEEKIVYVHIVGGCVYSN